MDQVRQWSHLWRPLRLKVASNRFAVLAFAVVTVIATLLNLKRDAGVFAALADGVRYGGGAFLAWAVAREVDPDRLATARIAVLVYLAVAWTGIPDLAAIAAVLLTARVIVRTTGRSPTVVDLGALVVLAGLAATSTVGLVMALGIAWALHIDRRLIDPGPDRESELAAVAAGAVAITVTIASRAPFGTEWELPSLLGWLVLAATAYGATTLRATTVTSVGDRTRLPLSLERLVHGRRVVLVLLAGGLLWAGGATIGALGPVFAAVIGSGLVSSRVVQRVAAAVSSD